MISPVMEHNKADPPYRWLNGGPTAMVFDIKETEDPRFEQWICSPILKETQETKNQIDNIYSQGMWDDYKKITNPYEYVFLSLNRRMSRSVAVKTPLSRSYFKMLEMLKGADLINEVAQLIERDGGLITSHAAEGPGGFIEAVHDVLPGRVLFSQGMTLRSTSVNIPGWRKTTNFLHRHPQVKITYGADDTGDLLKVYNIDHFVQQFNKKAHLYTADGGFDFSSDFNAQEETILPLLVAEFYLGLKSIQRGGVILVKIFDTLLRPTLELIWIVTRQFREWTIVKPNTSRGGNAERYLLCKGFLGLDEPTERFFCRAMETANEGRTIASFLQTKPPISWIQTMLTVQEQISQQETAIIRQTLNLIQKPDRATIRRFIEQNVERSIQWCVDHNEAVNRRWHDPLWREQTILDEINELVDTRAVNSFTSDWRSPSEASQTDSPEQSRPQRRHHVVTFSRSRPSRFERSSARARRVGSPDSEGWQRV